MNNKKTLHVIIPAVPRPEIHKICFVNVLNILKDSKLYNLKIYINFDVPFFLLSDCDEKIKETLNMCNNLDIKTIINKTDPCFSNAFFNLFQLLENNCHENDIFMWLEDDWELIDSQKFLESIILLDQWCTVSLVNAGPSGPPFLFKNNFLNSIKNKVKIFNKSSHFYKIDPEVIIQKSFEENNEIKNIRTGHRKEHREPNLKEIFIDRGTAWRKSNNIQKWSAKRDKKNKAWRKK